ncbi:hypothetical protein [Cypionkella sp.]|uniref:hypothetical protein n=1 Tax=Cypionkella sp. TaxID=2811411 RepID=UPI0026281403|nr:hypothetical protein [Cypionkella sp.]
MIAVFNDAERAHDPQFGVRIAWCWQWGRTHWKATLCGLDRDHAGVCGDRAVEAVLRAW